MKKIDQNMKMNKIWDSISSKLSMQESEKQFIELAVKAGIEKEAAEMFLMGGDI